MTSITATEPTGATTPAGRRNALTTVAVLVVTGAIILAVAYLANQPAADVGGAGTFTSVDVEGAANGSAPVVDALAPDFSSVTADGTQLKLSDFRGGPVWLTFGASWCQPCRAENPDIQAAYLANAGRVTVIQVFMDEDATAVADYAQRVGISYLTVPDPNERLASQYRILGIPSHFFIDADGVLRQSKVGSLDPTTMQAALAQIAE